MKPVLTIFSKLAFATLLLLSACSKQDNYNPAPAAQNPNPLPGTGVAGVGLNLEDPSPGTPLNGANYQLALQTLYRNFTGVGKAAGQSQRVIDYLVQMNYGNTVFQPTPSQSQPNLPLLTYDIQSNGDSVLFYNRYEGSFTFTFCESYNLYGRILYSTDQMALYKSGNLLLKVLYASPNPPMAMYELEAYGGQYGQISLHVTNVQMATTFINGGYP